MSLAPGRQIVGADGIAYLRTQGLAIPSGSNQRGTLLVSFTSPSSVDAAYADARKPDDDP